MNPSRDQLSLVPEVTALHTAASCYSRWHHWCPCAASFDRNLLFAATVVAVVFALLYRSVFSSFVQIYHQIGFKVFLNDPDILSKMSIMRNGQEDQSYGEQGALREPGVGGAEGHLPYALWVRPQTKAQQIQAGQAARPSLQWGRGDSGDDVCVCAGECFC